MQGSGEITERRFGIHLAALGAITGRGRGAGSVTVNQRGEQSAVNVSGQGGVIWLGLEVRNRFIPVPMTFDLVAEFVLASTAVADSEVIGVIILKGFIGHEREGSFVIYVNHR